MRTAALWITALNRWLATFSGLLTAIITLIVCVDVAARGLANHSLPGASEVAVLLLLAVVFLGFARAQAQGENFSVTVFTQSLRPELRRRFQVVADLVSLLTVSLIAWFSWSKAIDSTKAGEESYGTISFPVWPSRLLIAFGLTMLALQLVAGLLRSAGDSETGEAGEAP
jgi:TRAP-type transport system small permease protein